MSLPSVLSMPAAVLAAALGGWIFQTMGVPLAWILGAMTGSALYANILGTTANTKNIRRAGQLILGAATAAVLTPDILRTMGGLLPAMVAGAIVANLAGVLLAWPLAWIAGVDRLTALMSTLPAGMAEMASLASEIGARPEIVTVVHTLRIVMVVATVPFVLGVSATVAPSQAAPGATYAALVACLAAGGALSYFGGRMGLLNPWIIMPMACGVVLVALGFPLALMPNPLVIAAQIFIGLALGMRLKRRDLARVPRAVAAALVCGGALIAFMIFAVAPLLQLWTGLDHATLALGLAPGGLGEMIASAKALGVASALVAGFQFVRSFLTNMIAPPLIIRLAGSIPRKGPPDAHS